MIETLAQLLHNTLKSYPKPDFILYKKEGKYVPISTEEFGIKVRNFCLGLRDLGLEKGDKVILLSENRPEWVMTDLVLSSILCEFRQRYFLEDRQIIGYFSYRILFPMNLHL